MASNGVVRSVNVKELGEIERLIAREIGSTIGHPFGHGTVSSFETQGYIRNIPSIYELERLLNGGILQIMGYFEANNLLGFLSYFPNAAEIPDDYVGYHHKHIAAQRLAEGLKIKKEQIVWLDLLLVDKRKRGSRAGATLMSEVMQQAGNDKVFAGLVNPFNGYAIQFLQKKGFYLLLHSGKPTYFQYRFKHHPIFGSEEVPWIIFANIPNVKSNSLRKLLQSNRVCLEIPGKKKDFYLARLQVGADPKNPGELWMVDLIGGYLLLTTDPSISRRRREVSIELFNRFDDTRQEVHLAVAKLWQCEDYNEYTQARERAKEKAKQISGVNEPKIVELGGGLFTGAGTTSIATVIDKDNPIDMSTLHDGLEQGLKHEDAHVLAAKSLFTRFFNYSKGCDYGRNARIDLLEFLIKHILFNAQILVMAEADVDRFGPDIEKVRQCVDKGWGMVNRMVNKRLPRRSIYSQKEWWTMFWWYALVTSSGLAEAFSTHLATYKGLLSVEERQVQTREIAAPIRRGRVWLIEPRVHCLYRFWHCYFMNREYFKLFPVLWKEETFKKIIQEQKSYGWTRYSDALVMWHQENGTTDRQENLLFIITDDEHIAASLGVLPSQQHLPPLLTSSFHGGECLLLSKPLSENERGHTNEASIRWGEHRFPSLTGAYFRQNGREIQRVLYNGTCSPQPQYSLLGISIQRYVDRLKGYASLSAIWRIPTKYAPFMGEKEIAALARNLLDDLLTLEERWVRDQFMRFSTQNAISSIMSRNMSHNIGSHVLARIVMGAIDGWTQGLTVEQIVSNLLNAGNQEQARSLVVWGKGVQFLARYLQQRMDFIAQISTEWPIWSEPTWFMRDMMRWFLSQKHLLDYIARSDGLKAHLYEQSSAASATGSPRDSADSSSDSPEQEQEEKLGDIRLHVFMVPEECWDKQCGNGQATCVQARKTRIENHKNNDTILVGHHILLYTPGDGTAQCCLDEDFMVAIPGGVVGQHAFFTILENITRNAAKHGYAQQKHEVDHLDVVIEVLYDPEEKVAIRNEVGDREKRIPARLFRIYTNVSPVEGDSAVVSVEKINKILGTGIIKETGEMVKENWGHAEMKIAAGYLQRRDILHIGGTGQEITGEPGKTMLTLGQENQGSRAIIRAVKSPIGTLGYEFYIPRPRAVGIVCPEGGAS